MRPGQIGQAAGDHGQLHRRRHRDRILGAGNRRVHQHAVGAQLHGHGGIRGRADAGVDDDRHAGEFADDADVVRVLNAEAGADRRAERHHRGRARVLQLPAGNRVVVGVRQHHEPFPDQHLRRFEQRFVVGEERPLVADHLELHPVRQPRLASEPRGPDRFVRRVAAGGVRQDEHPAVSM